MSAALERYFRLLPGSIVGRALKWDRIECGVDGGGKWVMPSCQGVVTLKGDSSSVLWRRSQRRRRPAWPAFAQRVRATEAVQEEPAHVAIRGVVPIVADAISAVGNRLSVGQDRLRSPPPPLSGHGCSSWCL